MWEMRAKRSDVGEALDTERSSVVKDEMLKY